MRILFRKDKAIAVKVSSSKLLLRVMGTHAFVLLVRNRQAGIRDRDPFAELSVQDNMVGVGYMALNIRKKDEARHCSFTH